MASFLWRAPRVLSLVCQRSRALSLCQRLDQIKYDADMTTRPIHSYYQGWLRGNGPSCASSRGPLRPGQISRYTKPMGLSGWSAIGLLIEQQKPWRFRVRQHEYHAANLTVDLIIIFVLQQS